MTNRQTTGVAYKIPEVPYISGICRFKERDSYHKPMVYCSFLGSGHHA